MTDLVPNASKPLPRAVKWFWGINLSLGLICAFVMHVINRQLLHLYWPYSTPFLAVGRFWDFSVYRDRFHAFHSPAFFSPNADPVHPFEYPAPVALLYKAFYAVHWHTVRFYIAVSAFALLVFVALFLISLIRKGVSRSTAVLFVGSFLICSYPTWLEFHLGNMEIWIFVLVAAALLLYLRGNTYTSAVLIGIAASMKIFPAVYLGLFLPRKQYKQIAVSVLTAIALNFFSLWAVCPDIKTSMKGISAGLAENKSHYMLNYLIAETGMDHSLFGFFKWSRVMLHGSPEIPPKMLTGYLAAAVIVGGLLYFLRIYRMPVLNQIAALCIASILFPPTSHDYTLLHLFVPFGLLVFFALDHGTDKRWAGVLMGIFVCFGILFSPEAEVIHHRMQFSGQLKAIVLVVLLALVLKIPFPASFSGVAERDFSPQT